MGEFDDHDISLTLQLNPTLSKEGLGNWTLRTPSPGARRWSVLHGLARGLVWAFPFVTLALLWRRASGSDGNTFWPAFFFTIGMLLLIIQLVKGILMPRTWWFAYTDRELILEHGVLFKARDHLAFDRVQYLERRTGPIMRPAGLASLIFDTAAGRATVPAAELADIQAIEDHVRVAMQRASLV